MHGLRFGSLHSLVELGCDRLMSHLSVICLSSSFSHLGCETFLDFLRLKVQDFYLHVDASDLAAYYLGL